MKEYTVICLDGTRMWEENFNINYHKKYIGKIGEEINHTFKTGVFQNFKLLIFDKDAQGRPQDADWFHFSDLERTEN